MMRTAKQPPAKKMDNPLDKSTILVCRHCNLEATHNKVLRVSYCPVHGLGSPLDSRSVLRFQACRTTPSQMTYHSGKPGW